MVCDMPNGKTWTVKKTAHRRIVKQRRLALWGDRPFDSPRGSGEDTDLCPKQRSMLRAAAAARLLLVSACSTSILDAPLIAAFRVPPAVCLAPSAPPPPPAATHAAAVTAPPVVAQSTGKVHSTRLGKPTATTAALPTRRRNAAAAAVEGADQGASVLEHASTRDWAPTRDRAPGTGRRRTSTSSNTGRGGSTKGKRAAKVLSEYVDGIEPARLLEHAEEIQLARQVQRLKTLEQIYLSLGQGAVGAPEGGAPTTGALRRGGRAAANAGTAAGSAPAVRGLILSLKDTLSRSGDQVVDLFRAWDEDGSGTVDRGEFYRAIRALGFIIEQEEANMVFDALDEDQSGVLEYKELNTMLRESAREAIRADGGASRDEWAAAANVTVAELRQQLRAGKRARERIVASNLGLVGYAIRLLKRSSGGRIDEGTTEADLLQEGCIALLHAAEGFDVSLGVRFGTYATFWVRAAIKRALQEQTRIVRLPSRVQNTYGQIMRATDALSRGQSSSAGGSQLPSDNAISEKLEEGGVKLSPQKVRQIIGQVRVRPTSLDRTLDRRGGKGDDDGTTVGDLVRDASKPPPEREMIEDSLRTDLGKVMAKHLREDEAKVLTLRFGLADGASRTVRQVSEETGLTYARTKHVLFSALSKLRKPHVAVALRDYLPGNGDEL